MSAPRVRIIAPSRLHFGLIARGDRHPRQFGSVGLMVEAPGLLAEVQPSSSWSTEGPLADRALTIMRGVAETLSQRAGRALRPLHLTIHRAPPEHVGLGTGTQLSLAVARLVLADAGETNPSAADLVALTGRGRRSGVGLHGSSLGGLIVDGGRSAESPFPPLLSRVEFPGEWSILIVIPPTGHGLAGTKEMEAFLRLPPVPPRTVERLCRLVLLGLLPAASERDLTAFGSALSDIQREVGRGFAPVQGGLFADPRLEEIAAAMQQLGLVGVGQSSWGPALFGFTRRDPERQSWIVRTLLDQFYLEESCLFWTAASPGGTRIEIDE